VLGDRGLAAEVRHLEQRLDDMHDRLETWVLRAAASDNDPSPLRGLLHLAAASEDIGDQASQMVMLVEMGEDIHPVLGVALADAAEVVVRLVNLAQEVGISDVGALAVAAGPSINPIMPWVCARWALPVSRRPRHILISLGVRQMRTRSRTAK